MPSRSRRAGGRRVGPGRGQIHAVAARAAGGTALLLAVVAGGSPAAVAGEGAAGRAVGAAASVAARSGRPGDGALAAAVRRAVAGAGFTGLADFGSQEGLCPGGPGCPAAAPPAAHVPNVDTAVIELDDAGRVVAAADVLLSRDYPDPVAVPVDADLRVTDVNWYRWDLARADGPTPWDARRVTSDEVVPAAANARYTFMSPYPASLFQLMVAAGTLHLVDQGVIRLDGEYHYLQAPGSTCLGSIFSDSRTTRVMLDRMITASDTSSTCMLLKQLGDLGQLDAVTAWLSGLGLDTLQLSGIDLGSGGRWQPRQITMTAMDTARLLLLVNGVPGVAWHVTGQGSVGAAGSRHTGASVTTDSALSPASRALLRGLLANQGFNEVLSTSNWCGRSYPAAGIPQLVPQRWIDGPSGTVTVDDIPYGQDVRPCNASAQVTFAHKTGLTYNFGADAGIVDSLPGARDRHYVIVVLSDLGYRYSDLRNSASPVLPCMIDVCYPEAFARLGRAVDDAIADRVGAEGVAHLPGVAGGGPTVPPAASPSVKVSAQPIVPQEDSPAGARPRGSVIAAVWQGR